MEASENIYEVWPNIVEERGSRENVCLMRK